MECFLYDIVLTAFIICLQDFTKMSHKLGVNPKKYISSCTAQFLNELYLDTLCDAYYKQYKSYSKLIINKIFFDLHCWEVQIRYSEFNVIQRNYFKVFTKIGKFEMGVRSIFLQYFELTC